MANPSLPSWQYDFIISQQTWSLLRSCKAQNEWFSIVVDSEAKEPHLSPTLAAYSVIVSQISNDKCKSCGEVTTPASFYTDKNCSRYQSRNSSLSKKDSHDELRTEILGKVYYSATMIIISTLELNNRLVIFFWEHGKRDLTDFQHPSLARPQTQKRCTTQQF